MPQKGEVGMAVLLTGVPVSDEQAKEQAPVETPETDKPVDGEDSVPVCVPEGWASLVNLDPDAEASLTELLRLMKQERYDVIPSLSGYLVTSMIMDSSLQQMDIKVIRNLFM